MPDDSDLSAAALDGSGVDTTSLRHRVLNDYNAVIACIFAECSRTTCDEVKEALSRVAECVYDLASSFRERR
jgi:hypothetical protein